MRFDLPRVMGMIYPILVVGLIVLFLVSFYLFINRMVTSRRDTVISLRNIEHKLDLILNEMNVTKHTTEAHMNEVKRGDES